MRTEEEQRRRVHDARTRVHEGRDRSAILRRELRHQHAVNERWAARLEHRRTVLDQITNPPIKEALEWATDLAAEGCVEHPAFSNKGPHITKWQVDTGFTWVPAAKAGVPWCQCFANAFMVKAGCPQYRSGYTPDFVVWARNGANGFKQVDINKRKPGDLLYYKWPGVSSDICDHVGVVLLDINKDIEGNTSPGNAGSQNNGGGLYVRGAMTEASRRPFIVACVRPPYPKGGI